METLTKSLNTNIIGQQITYYSSIESTNKTAKEGAGTIFQEGAVVVADEQTQGRGRLGRQWVSKKGAGLWMSVVLKSKSTEQQMLSMPLIMAISVSQAIEQTIGEKAMIKWPNDIVCQRRKVCGMLAEMTMINNQKYIICGIGINVNISQIDFPEDIRQTATSLSEVVGMAVEKEQLFINVMECLDVQYKNLLDHQYNSIILEYKKRCITLNREIKVNTSKESYRAMAQDIAADGSLIINRNGVIQVVYAGDVSVRGINGYI